MKNSPLTTATVMLCTALLMAPAGADDGQKAQLQQLRQRIAELTENLNSDQDARSQLHRELSVIEKDIGRIVQRMQQAEGELKQLEADLSSLHQQRDRLKQQLRGHKTLLGKQIRVTYAMGRYFPLKLMLSAEDPKSVSRQMYYLNHFNQVRARRLRSISRELVELENLEEVIQSHRLQTKNTRDAYQAQKRKLQTRFKKRKTLTAKLSQNIEKKKAYLDTLRRNRQRLEKLVAALRSRPATPAPATPPAPAGTTPDKPFAQLKGRLHWPVSSEEAAKKQGNGVVLYTKEGQPVRAAAAGTVVFAEWLRGYGLLLILDHGQGYMTLYGHNQSLSKQLNEQVTAGEIIGTAGRSGGQQRSGVYFELRHQGRPDNPLDWMVKTVTRK